MPKSFSEQVQEAAESMSEQGMTLEYPEFVLAPGPDANQEELARFRERFRSEAARWREDPHHVPILPVPVTMNRLPRSVRRAIGEDIEDELGIECLPEEPIDQYQPRRKIEV
jgi:hypothetical protein